jgi:protein NUD1
MAQIRNDVKGQKRLFSEETDVSYIATHLDDKVNSFVRPSSPDTVPVPSYPLENKENQRPQGSHHRRTSSGKSHTSRHRGHTRKSISGANPISATNGCLVDEVSNLPVQDRWSQPVVSVASRPPSAELRLTFQVAQSMHTVVPSSLAPPSYPSSSLRAGQNDDLNRFVSSSTASGTTLTAGSAPSFVKHQGPAHIRTIAPTDLPQLPDRLGDMMFDKVMMKWVKNTVLATAAGGEMDGYVPTEEVSEDPFGDIESLRDDSRGREPLPYRAEAHDNGDLKGDMSRIDERSELDDDEEMELTSFSTDNPSSLVVDVMTGVETIDDDETTDSEDDNPRLTIPEIHEVDYDSDDVLQQSISQFEVPIPPVRLSVPPRPGPNLITPHRGHSVTTSRTPVVRSALKSHSATPTSALKDPNRVRYQTPQQSKRHRRSVSFSDGKRDGPIRDLVDTIEREAVASGAASMASGGSGSIQSVRSRRIAQMMHALEDSGQSTDACVFFDILNKNLADSDESPLKTSSGSGRPKALQAFSTRRPSTATPNDSSRRMFSRSHTHKSSTGVNATFLTECSFGVAHNRLVEVITDVQPFLPHWEELSSVDLSGKRLESAARLKEFLPRLDALNLWVVSFRSRYEIQTTNSEVPQK